jgi:hypothetical protein
MHFQYAVLLIKQLYLFLNTQYGREILNKLFTNEL